MVCWFLGLVLDFGVVYRFTVVVCGFWWLVVLRVRIWFFLGFLILCGVGII